MMITTSHFFHGIEERSHVFIPLEFKHRKDTRPLWRMDFFSYLDGVWEWVQVTSDHMANHYSSGPCLCHCKSIISSTSTSVKYSTSNRVLSCIYPTFCLIIAQGRGHNPCKGSIRNVKVHPGTSDPPPQQIKHMGRIPPIKTWRVHT